MELPPGGIAYTHTHQGGGIRCLLKGGFNVRVHGETTELGEYDAWFEAGSDAVYAWAPDDAPGHFSRVMILPRRLKGKSSIRYVDPEDADKPQAAEIHDLPGRVHRDMTSNLRTGGQILADALLTHGVDTIFCVPGESYIATLDALFDVRDRIRIVTCRQEGGAAYMAEAYAKLTGRPGICFVTRGPWRDQRERRNPYGAPGFLADGRLSSARSRAAWRNGRPSRRSTSAG